MSIYLYLTYLYVYHTLTYRTRTHRKVNKMFLFVNWSINILLCLFLICYYSRYLGTERDEQYIQTRRDHNVDNLFQKHATF